MVMQPDTPRISFKDVPELPPDAYVTPDSKGVDAAVTRLALANFENEKIATGAVVFKAHGLFRVRIRNAKLNRNSRVAATITEVAEFSHQPVLGQAAMEIYMVTPGHQSCEVYGRIWWDSPLYARVGIIAPYEGTLLPNPG
jgi:hypothetical protein